MKIDQLIHVLKEELSGSEIIRHAANITQRHRVQGSLGFIDAASYIKSFLAEYQVDAEILTYPADGKDEVWGYVSPMSWNITFGEMHLVEPEEKRLCSFRDTPVCVVTQSPSADFEAEVVDAGKGDRPEDYADAKGKVAMITAIPRKAFAVAAEQGVKGLIVHPDAKRAFDIGESAVQYLSFFPDAEAVDQVIPGFSISARQALAMKAMLEKGKKVKVRFKLDCRFEGSDLAVLESRIPGSEKPEEEVVIIGHLCHPAPSANDNASGSATMTEMVLALNQLIKAGKLPRPARSIRFLWVPEFSGTVTWLRDYLKANGSAKKILCALNLDMVGESPAILGEPLNISLPSLSTPNYLAGLISHVAEKIANLETERDANGRSYRLDYRLTPFMGGSDHLIFNDPANSVPAVMLGHDDRFHHCSSDTLEKVDPKECVSAAVLAGAAALGLAAPDPDFITEFTLACAKLAQSQAFDLCMKSRDLAPEKAGLLIDRMEAYHLSGLKRALALEPAMTSQKGKDILTSRLKDQYAAIRGLLAADPGDDDSGEGLTKVYERTFEGITPHKVLNNPKRSREEQKKLEDNLGYHGALMLEFMNLADGKTTLEEVFLLLRAHYPGLTPESMVTISEICMNEGLVKPV